MGYIPKMTAKPQIDLNPKRRHDILLRSERILMPSHWPCHCCVLVLSVWRRGIYDMKIIFLFFSIHSRKLLLMAVSKYEIVSGQCTVGLTLFILMPKENNY